MAGALTLGPGPRAGAAARGRCRFLIYGADHGYEDEPGTDLAAVAEGMISVTPLHFDLTYVDGIQH
ncbi:MAG: hypothetical protein ACKOTH_09110, partial [Solirubrobacterales bacterium]